MKYKKILLLFVIFALVVFSGCSIETSGVKEEKDLSKKQRIMVVVSDKETKVPIKDAKIYIMGDSTVYTTDDMGKTPEILMNINKDYFSKYNDEISEKITSGFLNVVTVKDGYGKHYEGDYNVYPGNSIYLVKIELTKGSKSTLNINKPDESYVENILKGYEKFEGEGLKSDNMTKCKIKITDTAGKPLEGVKVVIPEAKLSSKTNSKGICEAQIPYDDSSNVEYSVKKEYGEITILTYKKDYPSMVLIKVPMHKDDKKNEVTIKLKKDSKDKWQYNVYKPYSEWLNRIIDSCK